MTPTTIRTSRFSGCSAASSGVSTPCSADGGRTRTSWARTTPRTSGPNIRLASCSSRAPSPSGSCAIGVSEPGRARDQAQALGQLRLGLAAAARCRRGRTAAAAGPSRPRHVRLHLGDDGQQVGARWGAHRPFSCRAVVEFEHGHPQPRRQPARARPRLLVPVAVAVLLILVFGGVLVSLYTDLLWFRETGFSKVFSTVLRTKLLLFVIFGLLMAVAIGSNLALAYRMRPPFRPMSLEQQNLEKYRLAVERFMVPVMLGGERGVRDLRGDRRGRSLGDLAAVAQRAAVRDDRPAVPQGPVVLHVHLPDAAVHPRLRDGDPGAVAAGVGGHALPVRRGAAAERGGADQRRGAGAPVGAGRADRAGEGGRLLAGPVRAAVLAARGGAGRRRTPTSTRCCRPRRCWSASRSSAGCCSSRTSWCATCCCRPVRWRCWSSARSRSAGSTRRYVQRFQVRPNEVAKESAYIQRNIDATREAYQIDDVDIQQYNAVATATRRRCATTSGRSRTRGCSTRTSSGRRSRTTRAIRNYFGFNDSLDIDRYTIDGKTQDYVVAVREVDQSRLRSRPAELDQPAPDLHARQRLRRRRRRTARPTTGRRCSR